MEAVCALHRHLPPHVRPVLAVPEEQRDSIPECQPHRAVEGSPGLRSSLPSGLGKAATDSAPRDGGGQPHQRGHHFEETWPEPPCSVDLAVHYSFDYAQQVHYPSNPLQPGPVYFLTPRKCGVFGVSSEGVNQQVRYYKYVYVYALKGKLCRPIRDCLLKAMHDRLLFIYLF